VNNGVYGLPSTKLGLFLLTSVSFTHIDFANNDPFPMTLMIVVKMRNVCSAFIVILLNKRFFRVLGLSFILCLLIWIRVVLIYISLIEGTRVPR
jgi:hypothetical protein